jgi:hypothetical protein
MATGQAIREELIYWGVLLLLGRSTAASGGADRIRDIVRLKSTSLASSAFDDCYVRLSGGNANGDVARVDYLNTANGDLYVTPDFSATPDIDTTYEIFRPGVDPDDVDRVRDRALTDICAQWFLHPISEVPNAAYVDNRTLGISSATLASPTVITTASAHGLPSSGTALVRITGVTGEAPDINGVHLATETAASTFTIPINVSDAADNNTGTVEFFTLPQNWTLANATVISRAALGFPMELSRYGLLITNSGTPDGQAQSDSIYVQPLERFFLHVPVSCRTGIGEIIVYDETQGAEIALTGTATATGRGWTGITVIGTVPSGCYEIKVYLNAQGTNDIVEWGPVYFHWQDQRRVDLPARVISRDWVGPTGMILDQLGEGARGQESLRELPSQIESISNNVALRMASPLRDHPYYYVEKAFFPALGETYRTSDTRLGADQVDSLCPTDYVVPAMVGLLAEMYRHKQPWAVEFWDRLGEHAARQLEAKHVEYGPRITIRTDRDRGFEEEAERSGENVGATEAATPAHKETRVAPERPPTIPPARSRRRE